MFLPCEDKISKLHKYSRIKIQCKYNKDTTKKKKTTTNNLPTPKLKDNHKKMSTSMCLCVDAITCSYTPNQYQVLELSTWTIKQNQ